MNQRITAVMQRLFFRNTAAVSDTKPRFAGIDIVKITACFLVVSIHFFLNSGFYTMPITPRVGTVAIYGRWIAYNSVPLFMITTGFLMKNKKLSGKYYLGAVRVLCIYIVISLICVIFNKCFFHLEYTGWQIIRGLFMYSDAKYAWYVEYYFTIFLLIPFLNAGYQAMETRGKKTALLVTVILLTMISQTFYIGTDRVNQIRIFPGYFNHCYPIGYYFIGAYIREFPPKRDLIHKIVFVIIALIALFYVSNITLYQSLNNTEKNTAWLSWHNDDYGAWPTVVMSTMIFLLLYDIQIKNPRTVRILSTLSNATFAAYLISYIYDAIAYKILIEKVTEVPRRFWYAPIVVLFVFTCSMLSGLLLQWLYDLAHDGICKWIDTIRQRKHKLHS